MADFIPGRDDRLYAFLWGSSPNPDDRSPDPVLVYTPSTDTWQLRQPETTRPYGVSTDEPMVAAGDGLIYAFAGGAEYTDVFAYDAEANTWTTSPVTQIANCYISDASAGADGTIYLLAGCLRDTGRIRLLTFDPATHSVNEVGSQPWGISTLAVDGDGLVIMAGDDGVGTYDPSAHVWAWVANPSPDSPPHNPRVTAGIDRLYSVGSGYSAWDVKGGWASVQPPKTSDPRAAATWFSNRLYVLTVDPAISGASPGRLHLLRFAPAR